jgi:hypothetical protein
MAINGWTRIGIVLSVLWAVSAGLWTWTQEVKSAQSSYVRDRDICLGTSRRAGASFDQNAYDKCAENAEKCPPRLSPLARYRLRGSRACSPCGRGDGSAEALNRCRQAL